MFCEIIIIGQSYIDLELHSCTAIVFWILRTKIVSNVVEMFLEDIHR